MEDNQSFLDEIKQFETTILKSPDEFYDSDISNMNDDKTVKPSVQFKKKEFEVDEKVMDLLRMEQLTQTESIMSEKNRQQLSYLIGTGKRKSAKKSLDTETETDSDDDDRRVKKVVYRNDIGKIDQKISVSNFNCSCRVF